MKNVRPTHNLSLVLIDGTPVSCTVKTPKMTLVATVRQLVLEAQMKAEQCNAYYMTTDPINRRLVAAQMELDRIVYGANTMDTAEQAAIAEQKALVESIKAELDNATKNVNALNKKQLELLQQQVELIINIPNDPETKEPRTLDLIDWEEADKDELTEGVSFFLNGPKS